MAIEDLDGDRNGEVIATGQRLDDVKQKGRVEVLDADGTLLHGADVNDGPSDLAIFDLDGDGPKEVIVALAPVGLGSSVACSVEAFSASLVSLWNAPADLCFVAHLAVGRVENETVIAYGDATLFTPPHAMLLSSNGNRRWIVESPATIKLAFHRDRLMQAGTATEGRGRLARLSTQDGSTEWEVFFDGVEDVGAGVLDVADVPDLTGDGERDLLLGLGTGEAVLLDGATREPVWKKAFEPADAVAADRHTIAAVAYLPPEGTRDAMFLLAQGATSRMKSAALAVNLDGEVITSVRLEGETRALTLAQAPGTVAWLGAGLDVYALEPLLQE